MLKRNYTDATPANATSGSGEEGNVYITANAFPTDKKPFGVDYTVGKREYVRVFPKIALDPNASAPQTLVFEIAPESTPGAQLDLANSIVTMKFKADAGMVRKGAGLQLFHTALMFAEDELYINGVKIANRTQKLEPFSTFVAMLLDEPYQQPPLVTTGMQYDAVNTMYVSLPKDFRAVGVISPWTKNTPWATAPLVTSDADAKLAYYQDPWTAVQIQGLLDCVRFFTNAETTNDESNIYVQYRSYNPMMRQNYYLPLSLGIRWELKQTSVNFAYMTRTGFTQNGTTAADFDTADLVRGETAGVGTPTAPTVAWQVTDVWWDTCRVQLSTLGAASFDNVLRDPITMGVLTYPVRRHDTSSIAVPLGSSQFTYNAVNGRAPQAIAIHFVPDGSTRYDSFDRTSHPFLMGASYTNIGTGSTVEMDRSTSGPRFNLANLEVSVGGERFPMRRQIQHDIGLEGVLQPWVGPSARQDYEEYRGLTRVYRDGNKGDLQPFVSQEVFESGYLSMIFINLQKNGSTPWGMQPNVPVNAELQIRATFNQATVRNYTAIVTCIFNDVVVVAPSGGQVNTSF